ADMAEGDLRLNRNHAHAAGSAEQRDIDHVEPAQDAVDDRPQDRMVVGIGDRDGERRAEADAVFRALDPNAVISISVHGDPFHRRAVMGPSGGPAPSGDYQAPRSKS